MTTTTCIRNAACIVAWDAANHRHAYLMGGDVAFSGDTLSFVGRHYDGAADTTIDGSNLMVMPGLIESAFAPQHRTVLSAACARNTACPRCT